MQESLPQARPSLPASHVAGVSQGSADVAAASTALAYTAGSLEAYARVG